MKIPSPVRRYALVGFALALPGVWLGCNLIFDIEAGNLVNESEAGSPESGGNDTSVGEAGVDASGPVIGKELLYYVTDTKVSTVATDLTDAGIVLHVIEADGGLTDYAAVGKGDGTFQVDGVPPGARYYVEVPPPPLGNYLRTFMFSDHRLVDMSVYYTGRPNVVITDGGADASAVTSHVNYNIYGMSPDVAANAPNAGLTAGSMGAGTSFGIGQGYDPGTGQLTSTVGYGATGIDGGDPFYSGTPLIDGLGSGDLTYVTGTALLDAGLDPTNPESAVLQGFSAGTNLTMPYSATATGQLTGTLATLPLATVDGGVPHVMWNRGAFVAATGDISSVNKANFQQLQVFSEPFGDTVGAVGGVTTLFNYSLGGSTYGGDTSNENIAVTFGDPFPTSWTRVIDTYISVRVPENLPLADGGIKSFNRNGFVYCYYKLADVAGGTIAPVVTPPKGFQVSGHPGGNDQTGAGLQPTISWSPPSTGSPSNYLVNVARLAYDPVSHLVTQTFLAVFYTTPSFNQITIPAGIITSGQHYLFTIQALTSSFGSDTPQQSGLPFCQTNTVSGMISP